MDGRAPFGLHKGQDFTEYDLTFVNNGMLFVGARNDDGRGYERLENRAANLQIPAVGNQRHVRAREARQM